jgi:hypothetical protein
MDSFINYIVSHKKFEQFKSSYSRIIWVGEIGKEFSFNDRGKDSIYLKNLTHSELTAIYKIWKEFPVNKTHVSISHYRRQILFNYKKTDSNFNNVYTSNFILPIKYINDNKLFIYNKDDLKTIQNYDLIVPIAEQLRISVKSHFINNHGYVGWNILSEALVDCGEEDILKEISSDQKFSTIFGNLFFMNKNIFQEFSGWLFNVTEKLEFLVSKLSDFNSHRFYGYPAERLLSEYLAKYVLSKKNIKFDEKPVVMIDFNNNEFWQYICDSDSFKRVWIWGAGSFGEKLLNGLSLMKRGEIISGFIDSSQQVNISQFCQYDCLSKEYFFKSKFRKNKDLVVVASSSWNQISEELLLAGLKENKDFFCLKGLS